MFSTFAARAGIPAADLEPFREAFSRAMADAEERWPQIGFPGFAGCLGDRFGEVHRLRGAAGAAVWFERLHAPDLYVAAACASGVSGAAGAFEPAFRADLARTAGRFEGPRHPAEDLVQTVLEALLVGGAGRGPKLGEYAGQGPLRSWLKVVATRLCIDAVKGGAQHKREHPTDDLAAADLSDDVELGFIKTTYRAHFKTAFAEAVARLEPSERTLLKLSVLRGLNVDEIGAAFHVHRSTAARRVALARERLLSLTRDGLAASLAIEDEELDSIIGLIQSRLEVSLERLLETKSEVG